MAAAPRRSPALSALHDRFVAGEVDASYLDSSSLRPIVANSWRRSLAAGVDPDGAARFSPAGEELARLRETHPLAAALPVIRRLLADDGAGTGVVVGVTGADATLLWVEGDRSACRRAEAMNFVPGADWSEGSAGTNAPGTALAVDAELQILGSEHFSRAVQPWNCAAVPVHDPGTGALLGALDLTGGSRVASPQALALVRATVVAVESHLALLRLTGSAVEAAPRRPRLAVLGYERPRWLVTDEFGHLRATTLTGRHADILILLSRHPEGLSADHLAMLLDDNELEVVTVRAEMSRLRRVVGADVIESRPYRLLVSITTDLGEVEQALDAGDVTAALHRYSGPLLPQSTSPSVARLRNELRMAVRAAVHATDDPVVLRRWLDSSDGRDDRDGWRALLDGALLNSAQRAHATAKLAGLDFGLV